MISFESEMHDVEYKTRARYLAQLIDRYQDLDFVGIPELKDRQALHLEEVFISLQIEVELAAPELKELGGTEGIKAESGPFVAMRHARDTLKRRVLINEALREYPRMVILGDPGAGKTTLLKYITLAFAQNQPDRLGLNNETRLPIFVRLYDFVAKRAKHPGDYSLVDYLYTQAHENLLLDLP
ncbi:MAG: hypothetical protein HYR94_03810, partial [Chloroflexi bacterium]|nr:hypothetical protein [Chloroflexota bacterium]